MKHISLWVVTKKIKFKKIENSLGFPSLTLQRSHVQGFSALLELLPTCSPRGQFLPQLQGHGKDPGQRVHPDRRRPAQQGHQWAERKEHWGRHGLGYRQAGQRARGPSPGSLRPSCGRGRGGVTWPHGGWLVWFESGSPANKTFFTFKKKKKRFEKFSSLKIKKLKTREVDLSKFEN